MQSLAERGSPASISAYFNAWVDFMNFVARRRKGCYDPS
jgi:hypothetical protein